MSPRIALAQLFTNEAESGDHGFNHLHARTSFLETQYRICLMNYVNELITSLLIDVLLYKDLLFEHSSRFTSI